MIKLKSLIKEEKSEPIIYKGKSYFIGSTKGNKQVFVFKDKELKNPVKISGKTLMIRVSDIDYKLKK